MYVGTKERHTARPSCAATGWTTASSTCSRRPTAHRGGDGLPQRRHRRQVAPDPERRGPGRGPARGGERRRQRVPLRPHRGRRLQQAQPERVLLRHDRRSARRRRARTALVAEPPSRQPAASRDARGALQRRRRDRRRRRHRSQPGQHRHQRRLPDDQRGRHCLVSPRDGRQEPRRLDLAVRHRRGRRRRAHRSSVSPSSTRPAATALPSARECGRRAESSTRRTCSATTPGSSTCRRTHRRSAPGTNTVEDGQLLLMTGPDDDRKHDDDDGTRTASSRLR